MKKGCIVAVVVTVVLIVGVLVAVTQWYIPKIRREANDAFRHNAITEIERLTDDTVWISKHQASIPEVKWDGPRWFTQNLIEMTNREWIVYQAACRKSDWQVDDLFIGKGSDGKWYYTTYHFCVQMLELEGDGPSPDLPAFISEYSLQEFSGTADEDLKRTWPDR